MKNRIAIAAIAVIAVLAIVVATKRPKPAPAPAQPQSPPGRYVAAEGKVEAVPGYEVEVGSELDGKLVELNVREGDAVKKGDPIARIESREIREKVKESQAEAASASAKYREVETGARDEELRRAQAAVDKAKADAETAKKEASRFAELHKKGIVSRSQLDEAERLRDVSAAQQKAAEEELALLKAGPKKETLKFYADTKERAEAGSRYYSAILEKTQIRAPISGTVIRRYLQPGEMVSRDQQPTIVAIADLDKVRVSAEVDETDVGRFSIGDPADVTATAFSGKIFKGKVVEIANYAGLRKVTPNNPIKNRDLKVVQVKIELAEKTLLKLGMTVDVKIVPDKK